MCAATPCPVSTRIGRRVCASHTVMEPSAAAEANARPSGDQAAAVMSARLPLAVPTEPALVTDRPDDQVAPAGREQSGARPR